MKIHPVELVGRQQWYDMKTSKVVGLISPAS